MYCSYVEIDVFALGTRTYILAFRLQVFSLTEKSEKPRDLH
jgi:hypothetical protein